MAAEISDKLSDALETTLSAFRRALLSKDPNRFEAALAIANEHFQTELGLVARVHADQYTVEYSAGDSNIGKGFQKRLEDTLCWVTHNGQNVVQVSQVSSSSLADIPPWGEFTTERYVAVPLNVAGRRFGTLSFHAKRAGSPVSPKIEKELLSAMASWMEHALCVEELGLGQIDSEPLATSLENQTGNQRTGLRLTLPEIDAVLGSNLTCFFRYSAEKGFEWSRTTHRTFGYGTKPPERMRDPSWLMEQVHPLDRSELSEALMAIGQGRIAGGSRSFRVRAADGSFRFVRATVFQSAPSRLGQPGFIGSVQDISGANVRESQLQRRVEELEDFSRIVAHDILAPLRHASKLAAIMREDFGEVLGEDGNRVLGMIEASASRGLSMLHALSGLTQSTGRKQPAELVSTKRLLQTVSQEALALFGAEDAVVRLPEQDVTIWAHHAELSLILSNIIQNAFKYGGSPQEVLVQVETSPSTTVFRISDNGKGIPDRDKTRVFQPFFRLDPEGPQEGMGVGLSTVLQLVSARGGQVWIADRDDASGTTVVVSFPRLSDP